MSTIAQALLYLFPNARSPRDYVVQDDGAGPFIASWSLPDPQPTAAQLTAAITAYDAAQAQRDTRRAARRQRLRAAAVTAVGKDPTTAGLSATERAAVQTLAWERMGILDDDGKILPLELWADS